MQWNITGAVRATGANAALTLDAETQAEAAQKANAIGILVESAVAAPSALALAYQDGLTNKPSTPWLKVPEALAEWARGDNEYQEYIAKRVTSSTPNVETPSPPPLNELGHKAAARWPLVAIGGAIMVAGTFACYRHSICSGFLVIGAGFLLMLADPEIVRQKLQEHPFRFGKAFQHKWKRWVLVAGLAVMTFSGVLFYLGTQAKDHNMPIFGQMWGVYGVFIFLFGATLFLAPCYDPEQADRVRAAEANRQALRMYGHTSPQIVCQHCQCKGCVSVKQVKRKKGVSGGKATAALLTGGWSLFAVGLSRKETETQAHCSNCGSTWHYG